MWERINEHWELMPALGHKCLVKVSTPIHSGYFYQVDQTTGYAPSIVEARKAAMHLLAAKMHMCKNSEHLHVYSENAHNDSIPRIEPR